MAQSVGYLLAASGPVVVGWLRDSTDSWTGSGQTGDACALYDTDGDGNINFAICVRVNNTSPTVVQKSADSPFVFTCTDARSDRCSQPSNPLPYTSSDITATSLFGGANLITDTDPFPAGDDYPNDTTILLTVRNAFLPTGAGTTREQPEVGTAGTARDGHQPAQVLAVRPPLLAGGDGGSHRACPGE